MATNIPENLRYTDDHEWALNEDNIVTVGITDFAQSALGDIVFVELPEVGTDLSKGDSFGVVESIKSVSDLYSPLTGEVVEINENLESSPELCNESPYEGAWMIKIKVADTSEFDELLDAASYQEKCDSEQ